MDDKTDLFRAEGTLGAHPASGRPPPAPTSPSDGAGGQGVFYQMTDTRYGRVRSFTLDFWLAHDASSGPGWYVFGRCASGVIKIVAQPHVSPRRHPHYNIRVRRGWHRKRDAAAIASLLARQCFGPLPDTGDERDGFPPACACGRASAITGGSADPQFTGAAP